MLLKMEDSVVTALGRHLSLHKFVFWHSIEKTQLEI
jgi:hypothetical protein